MHAARVTCLPWENLHLKCKFQCKDSTGTIVDIYWKYSSCIQGELLIVCGICFDHSFVTRRVMLQSRAMEFLKAARTSLPVSADPNTFCSQLALVGVLRVQLNAKSCQVMQSHAKPLLNKLLL